MFPLFLDVTDRLVLVVGGGPVGRRKANSLLDAGAIVRLVCLEPQPVDWQLPRLVWMAEPYATDHLAGVSLAFACAAPAVNQLVAADAKRRGVWVNRADDPAGGDVVLPATLRRGEFIVSVGTGAAAPALAKHVRDQLESHFAPPTASGRHEGTSPTRPAKIANGSTRREF